MLKRLLLKPRLRSFETSLASPAALCRQSYIGPTSANVLPIRAIASFHSASSSLQPQDQPEITKMEDSDAALTSSNKPIVYRNPLQFRDISKEELLKMPLMEFIKYKPKGEKTPESAREFSLLFAEHKDILSLRQSYETEKEAVDAWCDFRKEIPRSHDLLALTRLIDNYLQTKERKSVLLAVQKNWNRILEERRKEGGIDGQSQEDISLLRCTSHIREPVVKGSKM